MESQPSPETFKRYGAEYYQKAPLLPELEQLIEESKIFTDPLEARKEMFAVQEIAASFSKGKEEVGRISEQDPHFRIRVKQAAWAGRMAEILQKAKAKIIRQVYQFFHENRYLSPQYQGIISEMLASRLLRQEGFDVYGSHPLLNAGGGVDLLAHRKSGKEEEYLAVQVKTAPYTSIIEAGEITEEMLSEWALAVKDPREDEDYKSIRNCFLSANAISALDKIKVTPVFIILPSLKTLEKEAAPTGEPVFQPYTFAPGPLLLDKWDKAPYFKRK